MDRLAAFGWSRISNFKRLRTCDAESSGSTHAGSNCSIIVRTRTNAYTPIQDRVFNIKDMLNVIYPVGSIYASMNNANPATLFGFGTWTQITDRFLWCSSGTSGETGGSKKILEANLPAHKHSVNINTDSKGAHKHTVTIYANENNDNYAHTRSGTWLAKWKSVETSETGSHTHNVSGNTGNAGSGTDYMPPFITVYAWWRVA